MSAVESTGGVASEYAHIEKYVEPAPGLTLGETVLKWYDIAPEDAPVPLVIRALARRNLRDAVKSGELRLAGELGFVILHRCGDGFYFLLVATWTNDNELWESIWAKNGEADVSFGPWAVEGTHRPTFCVWELGAVAHEQAAWSAYLRSTRSPMARQAYLRDTFDGIV